MGVFGKLFGKKKEEKPSIRPSKPVETSQSLDQFARIACRSKSSISIQIIQTAALIDALKDALQKEYASLDSGEVFGHAQGGLTLSCPRCGAFSEQAIPMLYLVGKGATQGAIFGGPNVAALGRGACPNCGGTSAVATFDPTKIIARAQAMKASVLEAASLPGMTSVCSSLAFQSNFDASPDENLICFVASEASGKGSVAVYDTGTANQRWSISVPSVGSCICKFVGQERVLVFSKKGENESAVQLVNAKDGTVVAETQGPKAYYSDKAADTKTGLFVTESAYDTLLMIQTGNDRLELSAYNCGQIYQPGPMIGPDGKCYVIVHYNLYCVENQRMKSIMPGDHCICFDSAGKVYCGGGYYDRSGESALHLADIQSGSSTKIPYGTEPINQIALAGPGRLLLANTVDDRSVARYPNATVTLFSVTEQRKIWNIEINDLKPWRNPLLLSVPDEKWMLIQTGTLIKQISLHDGKTLRVLPKTANEHIEARWLASKKLLYISRNPVVPYRPHGLGTLECYKI
jgi:hypothetical protein